MERARAGKLDQHLGVRMSNDSGGQGKKLEEWGKGYVLQARRAMGEEEVGSKATQFN